jgi:hypothetical protein
MSNDDLLAHEAMNGGQEGRKVDGQFTGFSEDQ